MAAQGEPRYHSPLRVRQTQETRALILRSLAEAIVEQGTAEVSTRDVADRADVAERTVYRHFPDRQALLDGLAQWVSEMVTAEGVTESEVTTFSELMETLVDTFRAFDRHGTLAEAMVMVSMSTGTRSVLHDQRSRQMRQVLEDRLSQQLGPDTEAVFAVIRHLMSAVTWYTLRSEFELSGETAGTTVAMLVEAALDNLG